jgi:hypothetical protein
MPRLPAAVAAFTVALALAGCGGGEDEGVDEFRDGYNSALTQLTRVGSDIGRSEAGDQSNREIAADFERFADTWDRTRANLSELTPPEDARDEFDELLAALEQGIGDLRAAARAARSDDPQAFADARESLSESGEEIADAEQELKDAVGE